MPDHPRTADCPDCMESLRLLFGQDEDKPMTKEESRRESWRRSSRKYRATQARERAQSVLFEESDE